MSYFIISKWDPFNSNETTEYSIAMYILRYSGDSLYSKKVVILLIKGVKNNWREREREKMYRYREWEEAIKKMS